MRMESGVDMPISDNEIQNAPDVPGDGQERNTHPAARVPSVIVGLVAAVVEMLAPRKVKVGRGFRFSIAHSDTDAA
jgi:hypothetical protein